MPNSTSPLLVAEVRYEEAPYAAILPGTARARWVVQATTPLEIFQTGETRESAVNRTREYLAGIGFRGVLKLIESGADIP